MKIDHQEEHHSVEQAGLQEGQWENQQVDQQE